MLVATSSATSTKIFGIYRVFGVFLSKVDPTSAFWLSAFVATYGYQLSQSS